MENKVEESHLKLAQEDFDAVIELARVCREEFQQLSRERQEEQMLFMSDILGTEAEALWRCGRRQEAINSIVGVYLLDPRSAEFASRVGVFMRKAKLPEVAMVYYSRALELAPGSVRTKMALKSLQTDMKLLRNSPGARRSSDFQFPPMPLLPSSLETVPRENWNLDDVEILSSSTSTVEPFSVPLSRAEPRDVDLKPKYGSYDVKRASILVPASEESSAPSKPAEAHHVQEGSSHACKILSEASTSTNSLPENILEHKSVQTEPTDVITTVRRGSGPTSRQLCSKSLLLSTVLVVVIALHNFLEGSSRPVFRVLGIPLSTITAVMLLYSFLR